MPFDVEKLRAALAKVQDPLFGKDIVALGYLKEALGDGDKAVIKLKLPTPAHPHKDELEKAVREAAKAAGASEVKLDVEAEVSSKLKPGGDKLAGVKNIIAVAAGKGGVGKSTVATNLALALRQHGATVGLLDADVYGPSVPTMLGEPDVPPGQKPGEKITPSVHWGIKVISVGFFVERGGAVIWRGPMVHKLLQQFIEDVDWGELDYLLVDLPPGTGDAQLSLSQLLPITGAVMVTTPQEVSIIDVEKALGMWKRVEVPVLGVVENMSGFVCPSCGHHEEIFLAGGGRKLAERESLPFLGSIPLQGAVSRGGDAGKPVVIADPSSQVARTFAGIAEAVACALSVRNTPEPGSGKRSSKLTLIR